MQDLGAEAGYAGARGFDPGPGPDSTPARARITPRGLDSLIETQILPRLLAARRRTAASSAPAGAVGRLDIESFVDALLARDSAAAFVFLSQCQSAGIDDVALMLGVFAPAARRLGLLWEQDACDFLQVTEGLARLETMLAELGRANELLISAAAPALLLMTVPGETHFLGPDMAAELFRREGWEAERAGPEGLRLLRARRFEAVGFSISCERLLPNLLALIEAVRETAAPRRPAILVGGALFASGGPSAAAVRNACEFNADFVAGDEGATLRVSRALLERRRL